MGGATAEKYGEEWELSKISIHAPRGGSDRKYFWRLGAYCDFNPRSPWGERPVSDSDPVVDHKFQSTLPVGGATYGQEFLRSYLGISIHAPRGGSDVCDTGQFQLLNISIHAPRGGSDFSRKGGDFMAWIISIHAPRGGSDSIRRLNTKQTEKFQSTLPVGGATCGSCNVTRW